MKKLLLASAIVAASTQAMAAPQTINGVFLENNSTSALVTTGIVGTPATALTLDLAAGGNILSATMTVADHITTSTDNAGGPPIADLTINNSNISYDLSLTGTPTEIDLTNYNFTWTWGTGAEGDDSVFTSQTHDKTCSAGPGIDGCATAILPSTPDMATLFLDLNFDNSINSWSLTFTNVQTTAGGTATTTTVYGSAVSEVPVPAAAWLFGSALVGLAGLGRKRKMA